MPALYLTYPYNGSTFDVGEEFTIKFELDKSGLTSAYSAYGVRLYIGGVSRGIFDVESDWTAYAEDVSIHTAGSYSMYGELVNRTSGVYLGYKSGTISVKVQATQKTYYAKVILNGNGGKYSGVETITYTNNGTSTGSSAYVYVNYSDPGFVRDGYELIGFSTSKTATSAQYDPNDSVLITAKSTSSSSPTTVTLYAVWAVKPKTYYAKLVLNGNGGTYSGESTISYAGNPKESTASYATISVTYSDPGFTRKGYNLLGFSTSSTATTATYGTSGTYSITATSTSYSSPTTKTLYAVWGKGRPSDWEWLPDVDITRGAEMRCNGDKVYPLTATKWLSFIARIEQFATYCGETLDSNELSAAKSGVSVGNRMTLAQINGGRNLVYQLRWYIGSGYSVPSAIKASDKITASFFNDLKNCLNSIE